MKIAEGIVEFIIHLLKSAILMAIIGVVIGAVLVVFTIFMPDEVVQAFDIIRGLIS